MTSYDVDLCLLMLRLSVSATFLFAGYWATASKGAFSRIAYECQCFFPFISSGDWRRKFGNVAAVIGMMMIFGGGISLLFGIESRLGGLTVSVFSVLGLRVHQVSLRIAQKAAGAGDEMGMKAVSALRGSAMKNWVVVAAGLTIFFMGGGRLGLGADYAGTYLGW